MDNWEWPQYLLAGWWIALFFIMVGVSIVKPMQQGIVKAYPTWVNIAFTVWILYMGGFWS